MGFSASPPDYAVSVHQDTGGTIIRVNGTPMAILQNSNGKLGLFSLGVASSMVLGMPTGPTARVVTEEV